MFPLNDCSLGVGLGVRMTMRPLRDRRFIFSSFVHSVPDIQGYFLQFLFNRFYTVLYEPSEPGRNLKGQCHEIFDPRFFSSIDHP
jgi:hypothetical protein